MFIFQIFVANVFGIDCDLDVFYASNTINFIFVGMAISSLNYAVTPILIKYYKDGDLDKLRELANSIFNVTFSFFLLLAFVQWLFAEQIVNVILPGFEGESKKLTIQFYSIQAFLSIFSVLTGILVALHYTFKQYYRTVIIPFVSQGIYIVFVFLSYKSCGIHSMLYGLVLSQMVTFLALGITFAVYYRMRIVFSREFVDALKKIYPLILSSAFSKSDILIDRFFASALQAGSITLLLYGQRIIGIVSNFINRGISIVSLRTFSLRQDNKEAFQEHFLLLYKGMVFIVVPTVFIIVFFLQDALQIIIFSKRITQSDVNNIYLVALSLAGVFIGGSLCGVIVNTFYAKGLTGIVSKMSIIINTVGFGLKLVLFYIMGFFGLPIAVSVKYLVTTVVLLVLYNKHIYKIEYRILLRYFVKMLSMAGVSIIVPLAVNAFITSWLIKAVCGSALFLMIYFMIGLYFEKDISANLYSRIKARFPILQHVMFMR